MHIYADDLFINYFNNETASNYFSPKFENKICIQVCFFAKSVHFFVINTNRNK